MPLFDEQGDWVRGRANRGEFDLDRPDRSYPIIEGDYSAHRGAWHRRDVVPGTVIPEASPIFVKLDDDIVDSELERMRDKE